MIKVPTLNPRAVNLSDYPFDSLRALLDPIAPPAGIAPLALSIGEPKHTPPSLISQTLGANADFWDRYPPIDGTPDFRAAVADWLNRRFGLPQGFIDAESQILPVVGTREALFMAALLAVDASVSEARPAVLFPNPLYHVYSGAAEMSGAEPVTMAATRENGFLPDLESLDDKTLSRTAIMYLCTPSNPQGTVADAAYLKKAIELAHKYGFVLALDECYSEIYSDRPPAGGAEICQQLGGMDNVLIFHSLSKRSSAPGLRSGFVAGDASLIKTFKRLRSFGGTTMPLPIMAASAALWRDEAHVEENRALYRQKFDLSDQLLKGHFGYQRPAGGFFLWLDVAAQGGGEEAAKKLWAQAALRVLPGAYLSRTQPDGSNPGKDYIRVALVHPPEITKIALEGILKVLR
ncbi:MAG: aminotransferase class I/II-fold pyridoxal phosphate-dependent enzyme [Rhodospirillaceae bacterium]|nr:aminotransferase class I/II-fold pyridoxal phosphate-dependent enzyme [Rhodospirillaceae bacterium]